MIRITSVKFSIGIITHQGHISKVNANDHSVTQWLSEWLSSLLERLVTLKIYILGTNANTQRRPDWSEQWWKWAKFKNSGYWIDKKMALLLHLILPLQCIIINWKVGARKILAHQLKKSLKNYKLCLPTGDIELYRLLGDIVFCFWEKVASLQLMLLSIIISIS